MSEGKPKSQEQFYQEHREDAEKLGKAQRSGNAKSLHEAVHDYHEHLEEAREAGDTRKHPELYDEAREEMKREEEYSSEVFSKGMPALTPEQEKAVEQMKRGFPDYWADNRALNLQKEFHLPKETIQFVAQEFMMHKVKEGKLTEARQLQKEYKIPVSEEYRNLLEREEKAKLALQELRNQRNESIIDTQFFKVFRSEGIDYIEASPYKGGLEEAIEYIKTHDTPMSVKVSFQCPKNSTVQLLEKLDAVAEEKRVPIKLSIDRDCVFDKEEVVAMELFTSKLWRSRIFTSY